MIKAIDELPAAILLAIGKKPPTFQSCHPRMFLSGVQFPIRLDSRLKHAGMTGFGNEISLTQQGAGNITLRDSKRRCLEILGVAFVSNFRFCAADFHCR
jgi:hypothetical protein